MAINYKKCPKCRSKNTIKISITWSHWVGGEEEVVHKTIRESTTSKFIEQIKMINLLNWKARYLDSGVCDGTQWSIEIITEGRNIKKRGDNMFPDEWDKFLN